MKTRTGTVLLVAGTCLAGLSPLLAGEAAAGEGWRSAHRCQAATAQEIKMTGVRNVGGTVRVASMEALAALPEGFTLPPWSGETADVYTDVVHYDSATIDGRPRPGATMLLEYLPFLGVPVEHQVDWSEADIVMLRMTVSDPCLQRIFSRWNLPARPGLVWQKVVENPEGVSVRQGVASAAVGFRMNAEVAAQAPLTLLGSAGRLFGIQNGSITNYVGWDLSDFDVLFGSGTLDLLWGGFALPGQFVEDDQWVALVPNYEYTFRRIPLPD